MAIFNNPPQPIQTARRNAVTFEDRVSMLLNGSGSSKQNPIQSKNPSGEDTTGEDGHAFTLRFGMADASETITGAVASYANDDGQQTGAWVSFRNSITRDTTNFLFSASLVIGADFPAVTSPTTQDGEAQLVLVSIRTSLGRSIHQEVWVAREPSDMVLFNGQITTATTPLLIEMTGIDELGATRTSWSVQFFPTWNDEIGRQHGAADVALQSNIRKPYGGAKTVEIRRTTIGGEVFLEETPIEQVTTMTWGPTTTEELQKFIFKFRSETGSSHYLSKAAWVKFFDCDEAGAGPPVASTDASNDPPIIIVPDGGVIFDTGGTIEVDVGSFGDGVGTNAENPSVDLVLTGYKGGHFKDGVAFRPIAGISSGTKTVNTSSLGAQSIDISTGDIADADMIVVEVQSPGGSQLGNSLVYVREDAVDYGDHPQTPAVAFSPFPSFNFTTRTLSFSITAPLFPLDSQITCSASPVYGAIANPSGSAQDYDDTFAVTGSQRTAFLSSAEANITGAKTVVFADWAESEDPDAVYVQIANSIGSGTFGQIFFPNGSRTNSSVVKTGPTISTASLGTAAVTNDRIDFTVDDNGGNVGTFTLHYSIVDSAQDTATSSVAGVNSSSGAKEIKVNANHDDIDGFYYIWIEGEQGQSNVLQIDNVGGARTLVG